MMNTGQLLEYNLRNIFLEKSYTKGGGDTIPRPFVKNQTRAYPWINILKFYKFCFYFCLSNWGLSKWLKLSCRPLAFTSYKAFWRNKKRHGTSLPGSFSAWFPKKNIYHVIFFYLTKFQCLIAFTLWDIGQYVYFYCLLTKLWRNKFWN